MKDKIVISMLALVTSVSTIVGAGDGAGGGEGPDHGQELPGLTAWVFAPEFFDRNESQGCPGFLNDGTVFVCSSTKPGTDWRFKSTYVMELVNDKWTGPEVAPFTSNMPYDFTVGPGGKTVCFTSLRSPDKTTSMLLEQTKIWAVTLSDGEGTEPVMLGASINAEEHYENYPGVARDGWICCMSWRDNTVCKTDIHLSGNPDGTNFFHSRS